MPTISQALASQAPAASPSVPTMVNYPSLWNAANAAAAAAANDPLSVPPRRRALSLHEDVEAAVRPTVTVSDEAVAVDGAVGAGGGGGDDPGIQFSHVASCTAFDTERLFYSAVYSVTQLIDKNCVFTLIWEVLPLCLGSR